MDPKAASRLLARVLGMKERDLASLEGEHIIPGGEEGMITRVHEALAARNARQPVELFRAATGLADWERQDGITTAEAIGFVRALTHVAKPGHMLTCGRLRPVAGAVGLPKDFEKARMRLAFRVLCTAFKLEPEKLLELAKPVRRPAELLAVRDLLLTHLERADFRPAAALVAAADIDVERVLERITPEIKPWHVFYSGGDGVWRLELRPLARGSPVQARDVTDEAHVHAAHPSEAAVMLNRTLEGCAA